MASRIQKNSKKQILFQIKRLYVVIKIQTLEHVLLSLPILLTFSSENTLFYSFVLILSDIRPLLVIFQTFKSILSQLLIIICSPFY